MKPETVQIKIHAILCSVDSVARPMIQNHKQFNGKYGCSYCLHKGVQVKIKRGTSRMYPYCSELIARTKAMHFQHIEQTFHEKRAVMGVKGPSIVSLLKNIDIADSFPPDYLHSCLEGVCKLFINAWFDSKNSNEIWYLGAKSKDFDEKLLAIRPPCELTRVPQSIIKNKYKASEWKNMTIYYSLPLLKEFMLPQYYKHWFLLVYSMNKFLNNKITPEDYKLATEAMDLFVKNIENLYGKKFMKYNTHLLQHMQCFIKNYGAMWAWSTFIFEDYNRILKMCFHGTQYIPEQICKMYHRLKYVRNRSEIFDNENSSEVARKAYTKMMNQCKVKKCIQYNDDLKIFGKPQKTTLSLTTKILIENLINEDIKDTAEIYHRFIYKNILFHSSAYKRLKKRNNSYIITSDKLLLTISALVKIKYLNSENFKYIVVGEKIEIINDQMCKYLHFNSKEFSFIGKLSSSQICIDVSAIDRKCIAIPYIHNHLCIIPLVNTIETD